MPCPESERPIFAADEAHLAGCPECRAQWAADRRVREVLGGAPVPQLRIGFNQRLRARLRYEAAFGPLDPRARFWMRLYWLATALASSFILLRIEWPQAPESQGVSYFWMFVLLASPLLSLLEADRLKRMMILTIRMFQ